MSLRVRLMLVSLLSFALIALATMVVAYRSVGDAGTGRADRVLRMQATAVVRSLVETGDAGSATAEAETATATPPPPPIDPREMDGRGPDGGRDGRGHHGGPHLPDRAQRFELIARIVDRSGIVLAQTSAAKELHGLPKVRATTSTPLTWRTITIDGTPYRVHERVWTDGSVVQVARPLAEVDAALRLLRRILIGVGLLAAAGSAVLSWWVAGSVLSPIRRMTRAADDIRTTGDMTTRVPVDHADPAFAALGASLNSMLDRLGAADHAQRTFVADASHELRTPLTSLRGNAEFLAERMPADDEAARETYEAIERDIDRIAQLATSLTTLAQIDAGAPLHVTTVDVGSLVAEERTRAAAAFPDHTFSEDVTLAEPVQSDPELLRRIIANLLTNAGTHTPPGTTVSITAVHAPDGWQLTVSDTGPGLSDEDASQVFERFRRGTLTASGGGSGLGLAIVRAAAEALGGSAEIDSSSTGLAVHVRIPTM